MLIQSGISNMPQTRIKAAPNTLPRHPEVTSFRPRWIRRSSFLESVVANTHTHAHVWESCNHRVFTESKVCEAATKKKKKKIHFQSSEWAAEWGLLSVWKCHWSPSKWCCEIVLILTRGGWKNIDNDEVFCFGSSGIISLLWEMI